MAKSIFDNAYWTGGKTYGSAIGEGVAAGSAVVPEEDRFSIDPNAGFKGSFSGLSQGGVVGAIAGGITSQVGTFSRVNRNLNDLETNFQGFSTDPFGNPLYNSGAFNQAQNNLKELNAGEKKITHSFDPATRVFSGLFGTRKKLNNAQEDVRRSILQQQSQFNQANLMSQRQQLARRSYEDQLNNIYGVPTGYY